MLRINIIEYNNFDSEQAKKLFKAMGLFEKAINSNFFKQSIINHKFKNKRRFLYNKGMTNEQIYNSIMLGAETLNPIQDFEADLYLNLDKSARRGRIIGYTNKNTNQIFTYESWFNDKPVYEYSGHIAHEWCHKLGFEHHKNPNYQRQYTVPYAVGYLIREISSSLYLNLTNLNNISHEIS